MTCTICSHISDGRHEVRTDEPVDALRTVRTWQAEGPDYSCIAFYRYESIRQCPSCGTCYQHTLMEDVESYYTLTQIYIERLSGYTEPTDT